MYMRALFCTATVTSYMDFDGKPASVYDGCMITELALKRHECSIINNKMVKPKNIRVLHSYSCLVHSQVTI